MTPVADMLTQIRNAQAVLHPTVDLPFSNLKYEIAKILEKEGFVEKVERRGRKAKKKIEITLKYESFREEISAGDKNKIPVISGLKIISKPGQRIYKGYHEIRRVKGGYGMGIISTSKGLMTDKEARRQKLGGEVICEIW